jgi:phosphatidylglycerophosphatase A
MSENQASGFGLQASGPKAPRWAWWVATGFGSGYLKPAPGTWGSLAALIPWALLQAALNRLLPLPDPENAATFSMSILPARQGIYLLTLIGLVWLAVRASELVAAETGSKDPSFIVADEWAGMWIALWPLQGLARPVDRHQLLTTAIVVGTGFLLFRLFDVWKPWPIRQIQALPGGEGIVADDVVAGLYAALLLQGVLAALLLALSL